MNLEQEKNIFLNSTKAIKAVNYAKKWFNDYNSSKLTPYYLTTFYNNEMLYRKEEPETYILNSYEALFWFWFKNRYERLMNEQKLAQANIEYETLIKEIEQNNIFNVVGNLFTSVIKYTPYLIIGGLLIYGISVLKK
ncbi:MAG: hypothetical protein GYA14_12880 [Ignavibacteria bacterium]|nr:hypothetical protein [Ignavibacteria bacterium]